MCKLYCFYDPGPFSKEGKASSYALHKTSTNAVLTSALQITYFSMYQTVQGIK